ncbi:MAG: hypothetical protein R3F55_16415 [Alphaproteobacteria bacterium]
MRLTDLSFEDWIEHAFGPAVRPHGAAWFFDADCAWWDPPPAQAIAHLTRLFADPVPALAWFADSQIAQGLTYLVDSMATGDDGWFSAPAVPVADRLRCIAAIGTLFAALFAPRCAPALGHLSEAGGPLNDVCYMWWDCFLHRAGRRPAAPGAGGRRAGGDAGHPGAAVARLPGKRAARPRPLARRPAAGGGADRRRLARHGRGCGPAAGRLCPQRPLRLRAVGPNRPPSACHPAAHPGDGHALAMIRGARGCVPPSVTAAVPRIHRSTPTQRGRDM